MVLISIRAMNTAINAATEFMYENLGYCFSSLFGMIMNYPDTNVFFFDLNQRYYLRPGIDSHTMQQWLTVLIFFSEEDNYEMPRSRQQILETGCHI
jgi:hypothetical protein